MWQFMFVQIITVKITIHLSRPAQLERCDTQTWFTYTKMYKILNTYIKSVWSADIGLA
jgi:hypothetical protein